MLNSTEFLSDYGVRAISKVRETDPYIFGYCGKEVVVKYEPAESTSGLFGGNSNWRGPIWMPVNYLIIESLQNFTNTMAAISNWSARQGLEGS